MNPELLSYAKANLAAGHSVPDVRATLVGGGWNPMEVDQAIAAAGGPPAPKPPLNASSQTPPPARPAPVVQTAQAPAAPAPTPVMGPPATVIDAYDPSGYALVGFFFTVLPVFIMSLSNAKHLPNGERWKGRMKIFVVLTVILVIGMTGFTGWMTRKIFDASTLAASGGTDAASSVMASSMGYLATLNIVWGAALIGNLAILILTVIHANRNELPVYQELKKAGSVRKKGAIRPILLGAVIYVLLNLVVAPASALLGGLFA
jgi:hypothetical protein